MKSNLSKKSARKAARKASLAVLESALAKLECEDILDFESPATLTREEARALGGVEIEIH